MMYRLDAPLSGASQNSIDYPMYEISPYHESTNLLAGHTVAVSVRLEHKGCCYVMDRGTGAPGTEILRKISVKIFICNGMMMGLVRIDAGIESARIVTTVRVAGQS